MHQIITTSAEETEEFANKFAKKYKRSFSTNKSGVIIALSGPLGAGKTTFIQGFAKGLGIKSKLTSPTFILVKEYPLPFRSDAKLYHIDLYRLESPQQLLDLGLKDLFDDSKNIILIEWAEKLINLWGKPVVKINLEYLSEFKRKMTITD